MPGDGSSLFDKDDPQLGLFDALPSDTVVDDERERLAELRRRLPDKLRLGTSSWTFPGWAGLVYHRRYGSQRAFVRESLREYAEHPLMRTVGIDRGYYTPVPESDLASYARQLPRDFRGGIKVWQQISMPVYPRHPRYGDLAGQANPDFLDVERFVDEVFTPVKSAFGARMGPWILEMAPSPVPIDPTWFCQKLGAFLRRAPNDFPFAVEIRDRRLLTASYVRTLQEHGGSHVFNFWSRMPNLRDQLEVPGLLNGQVAVSRLLLPPGTDYAELRDAFSPFDRVVSPQPEMREDVVEMIRRALDRDMDTYVLVNNKAEGSSPLTVLAIAERVAG